MPMSLHAHTPQLQVIEPRALRARDVAWCCTEEGGEIREQVTRHLHDASGRPLADWDPRLWAAGLPANTTVVRALSGSVLRHDSVDAGWRSTLPGADGQRLEIQDGRGSFSLTEFDSLLRPACVSESLAGQALTVVERYAYATASDALALHNQCGRLIRHDDPAGTLMFADHGLHGAALLEHRRFLNDPLTVDWPLDATGREAMLEPGEGHTTTFTFDATAQPVTQVDATGNRVTHVYDVTGLPEAVHLQSSGSERTQSLVSQIRYTAGGQIASERLGNGIVSENAYDPETGRLRRITAQQPGGALLQGLHYRYDAVGNVVEIEDQAQPTRFFANQKTDPINRYRYDSLSRLIQATGREVSTGANHGPDLPGLQNLPPDPDRLGNYTQTYQYDAGGNLLQLRHAGTQSFTRNLLVATNSNRSLQEDDADFEQRFDANGNLQQLLRGQSLSWDVRNQMSRVTTVRHQNGSEDDELYVYDGGSQRCRKVRSARTPARTLVSEVRYLPGLEVRSEPDGELLYVCSVQAGRSSVRVLHWEQGKPAGIENDQVRYSLNDHLGSSTLELDEAGLLISQELYYPFGGTSWWAARSAVEANYKTVRYSGKERDATGLYYYGFRYYAPWLMRWVSPDPAASIDGPNLFRFVRNNPCTLVDIAGRVGESPQFLALQDRLMKVVDSSPEAFDIITTRYEHDAYRNEILSSFKRDDYTGCDNDHFDNRFFPDVWELRYNFKNRENGHPLTHASQVTLVQYTLIAEREGFFGELPSVIKRTKIINEGVKAVVKLHGQNPDALKEVFLNETQNGRSTARILNDFGLTATRVEAIIGRFGDLDIHIHVKPIDSDPPVAEVPATRPLTGEQSIARASRFTVMPVTATAPQTPAFDSARKPLESAVPYSRFTVTAVSDVHSRSIARQPNFGS